MMELAPGQFSVLKDFARPSPLTVEARAVIGGANPGWVFVDRLVRPRVALVWAQGMEGFYLLGEHPPPGFAPQLDRFVSTVLEDRLRGIGCSSFEASGGNSECDAVLLRAFAHRQLDHESQWIYRTAAHPIRYQSSGRSVPLVEALDLAAADAPLDVRSTVLRFWASVEKFIEGGLGRCAIVDGMPVSLCMSGFVDGAVHAVHVETAPAHRRQGLAMSTATDFLADCLDRGGTAHWDCMVTNEASWRIAERLGLERVAEYRCYFFSL
jgi:hypothetical protein